MRASVARSPSAGGGAQQGRQSVRASLSGEALVWALSALAQVHRIAFDEKLVLGQFPPPHRLDTIERAAQRLGLQAEWVSRDASGLRELATPILVLLHPISREPPQASGIDRESLASLDAGAPEGRLALVLRIEGERVVLLEAQQSSPAVLPFTEFAARHAGVAGGGGRLIPMPGEPGRPRFESCMCIPHPFGRPARLASCNG